MLLIMGTSTCFLSLGVALSRWKKSVAEDGAGEVFPPSGVSAGISEGVFRESVSSAFRTPFPAEYPLRESSGGYILFILYNILLLKAESCGVSCAGFCGDSVGFPFSWRYHNGE